MFLDNFKYGQLLDENHKCTFFVEISKVVEYSKYHQNFFVKSEGPVEHFYFLNHIDSTKTGENIDLLDHLNMINF